MANGQSTSWATVGKLIVIGSLISIGISAAGHVTQSQAIAGALGVSCAIVFGLLYGRRGDATGAAALGGAATGFGCSVIGIGSGILMGDHPPVPGVIGGAVFGAIGAMIGRTLVSKKA